MSESVRILRRGAWIAGLMLAAHAAAPVMAAPTTEAQTPAVQAAVVTTSGSYLAGRHAQHTDDWSAAADFMTKALARDPDNAGLLRSTFLLHLGSGRGEDATKLARRFIAMEPTSHLATVQLIADDMLARRYAEAERRLSGATDDGLAQFIEPLLLAWLKVAQGDGEAALHALAPLGQTQGFAALHALHAGLVAELTGRDAEAADWYAKAIEDGAPLRVVQTVGGFYERTGRIEAARALYQEYSEGNPDTLLIQPALDRMAQGRGDAPPVVGDARQGMAEALFNIASALHQEGAGEMALLYGRIALHLRPDLPLARVMVGDILTQRDRHAEALEEYRAIGGDAGTQWLARLRMAERLEKLERHDEAVALLQAMADERPERFDALLQLGDLHRAAKNFDGAVEAYSAALDRIGEAQPHHWVVYYSRGVAYERSNRWTEAEKDLSRALELNPEQPYVLNYLGYSWIDRGENLDRGRAMVERAVELRPKDGYIIDSLGWALYRLGDYAGAVVHLERAVELKPLDPTINDHLGDAYWQVGRTTEAYYQWRRALQHAEEEDVAAEIRTKLENGLPRRQTAETGRAVQ